MPTADELKEVNVYTDGACLGNPGPGGYATLMVYGEKVKELSGGFRLTTITRMEMLAAIVGLESIKLKWRVVVWTDSKYLCDSVQQGWAKRWRSKGWVVKSGDKAKNIDLWIRLLAVLEEHEVRFEWVKGHAGHPENERCDELSVEASKGTDLPEDTGYVGETVSGLF